MASLPSPFLTPEEYLQQDSRAERPSEYYDGVMYPIEATTVNHSRIQSNLVGFLRQALRQGPCEALGSTVRVRLPNKRYVYPDILVICGKMARDDAEFETVLNPTVIVEVLSPSTGDFDRGGKADMYRALPTVKEYVIVAQDECIVQRYSRQSDHRWILEVITESDPVLHLESVNVDVPLSEIYDRVEFDPVE